MCGRFSLVNAEESMRRLFEYDGPALNLPPRYNIAPSQKVPVVKAGKEGGRSLAMMRWGLIPSWAKDAAIGNKMINARAETVAEKPAFRSAFRHRRCLVPADGFYEWKKLDGTKQPYRIGLEGDAPFAFAGLWEVWDGPEGAVRSFTIVTTDASAAIADIHDRMPVILPPRHFAGWIAEDTPPEVLLAMLGPYEGHAEDGGPLRAYPVSSRVNNVRNDDADLLKPAA